MSGLIPVLARGRSAAVARMLDTCTITRVLGQNTNPDTGVVTPTTITIYSGACRVKLPQPAASNAQIAGGPVALERPTLYVPTGAGAPSGLIADDKVVLTASTTDSMLVGRVYHVGGIVAGTQKSADRYEVVEVTG